MPFDAFIRGPAVVDALDIFAEAIARWMAAMAAVLRVDACDDAICTTFADDEVGLVDGLIVQVCDVGKRCCGQNCCLHFYIQVNVNNITKQGGVCSHHTGSGHTALSRILPAHRSDARAFAPARSIRCTPYQNVPPS